ncbi:unnamed protein product [Somion occarium]|uniref:C2H2-type domain-containing protein n=1 Tax=Somion occarium TaxID=3059160 RepID=A0ABP1E7Q2_9APHY
MVKPSGMSLLKQCAKCTYLLLWRCSPKDGQWLRKSDHEAATLWPFNIFAPLCKIAHIQKHVTTTYNFTGASDYAPPEVEPFARDDTLPTMSLDSDEDDIEAGWGAPYIPEDASEYPESGLRPQDLGENEIAVDPTLTVGRIPTKRKASATRGRGARGASRPRSSLSTPKKSSPLSGRATPKKATGNSPRPATPAPSAPVMSPLTKRFIERTNSIPNACSFRGCEFVGKDAEELNMHMKNPDHRQLRHPTKVIVPDRYA